MLQRMYRSEQIKLFLTHADLITDLLRREEEDLSEEDLNTLKTKVNLLEMRVKSVQTVRYLRRTDEAA